MCTGNQSSGTTNNSQSSGFGSSDWFGGSGRTEYVTANKPAASYSAGSGGTGGMGMYGAIAQMAFQTAGTVAGTIQDVKNTKITSTYNAGEYLKAAEQVKKEGALESADRTNSTKRLIETGKTVVGASGIENSGTVTQLATDTAAMGELDASRIRNNAEREALKYTQAAMMEVYKIQQARKSGQRKVVSSMLSGGMVQMS